MKLATDRNSYANTENFVLRHFHLDWNVDFPGKVLQGQVTLTFDVGLASEEIILDSRNLEIRAVTDASGAPLVWTLGEAHPALGSALKIKAPAHDGTTAVVHVEYSTTQKSEAIQFLTPEQTAGKVHPYVFTQCQAIHARSLLPCQDTPSVKCLYSAKVTAPRPLTVLMSAESIGSVPAENTTTFSFEQKVPIPSYLLALAAGNLESREIGPRSRVWSEPESVDAGAYEFAETENFIATGEALLTPYVWGRYDLLLLPPSFPYGGMENPVLTFVTPTLLAGDRSLANVVAHEIAHSWMGNLVTAATWDDFWLNEGFTVFTERKIIERIYGKPTAQFHAHTGYRHLHEDLLHIGLDHPYTSLVQNLDKVDPDDAFSSVPYEKGFNFLYYLEGVVGGPDVFEPFLRQWVVAHANTSVTTADFRNFFGAYFEGVASPHPKHPTAAVHAIGPAVSATIDWERWFTSTGEVPIPPTFDTSLSDLPIQSAEKWIEGADISAAETAGWSSSQWISFLDSIAAHQELPDSVGLITAERLTQLDASLAIGKSKNSEVMLRWQRINLLAGRAEIVESVKQFLLGQGRMKFVRPLYRDLHKAKSIPGAPELAVELFTKNHKIYHPVAQKMVAMDLGVTLSD